MACRAAQNLKPRYVDDNAPTPAPGHAGSDGGGDAAAAAAEDGESGAPQKEYLAAGLYSTQLRDPEAKRSARRSWCCCTVFLIWSCLCRRRIKKKEFAFPLPIHYGETLLQTPQDFRLPFDIWYQVEHNQLNLKSNVLSGDDKYTRVLRNHYGPEAERLVVLASAVLPVGSGSRSACFLAH